MDVRLKPDAALSRSPAAGPQEFRLPIFEFVILMASLMSLNALAIDAMVPALPAIGESLGVTRENERQLVVAAYMYGFGLTQLIYGPLADRFGRKRLLITSLLLYTGFALLCAAASSFGLLLAARVAQGAAAAGSRVLVIAVIRDRFEGSRMARLMSLIHIVFMIMPVLAPTFGQLTLLVAPWPWIFIGLAAFGATLIAWTGLRLPETLHPEHRRPFSLGAIYRAMRETLTQRQSVGYTSAFTLMMGALMAYLLSIQQIVFDVFGRPELIALAFAGTALPMAAASFLNSHIVERVGSRRIAHASAILFTLTALAHFLVALGGESIWLFLALLGVTLATFSVGSANFGALAMQPLGHIAGTASSVQGTITTIVGTTIGTMIGQAFDGTIFPMIGGFVVLGAGSIAIILWVERGRLFGEG